MVPLVQGLHCSIPCLDSDDRMSLGIMSFATEGVGTKNMFRGLVLVSLTCPQLKGTLKDNFFPRVLVPNTATCRQLIRCIPQ